MLAGRRDDSAALLASRAVDASMWSVFFKHLSSPYQYQQNGAIRRAESQGGVMWRDALNRPPQKCGLWIAEGVSSRSCSAPGDQSIGLSSSADTGSPRRW